MDNVIQIPEIPTEALQAVSATQAWTYNIIPRSVTNEKLEVLTCESLWTETGGEELEVILGKEVIPEFIERDTLHQLLAKYYRRGKQKDQAAMFDARHSDDFLLHIIHEAKDVGSSDIHFEIYEEMCRVRFRLDGKLTEKYIIKKDEYPAYINKIKIRARLDIAEKRKPQDGRIQIKTMEEKLDMRVSVVPTLYGEKVVLRLLSRDATDIRIEKLGFGKKQLNDYLRSIKKPHGIVLISGPTGSGKTTTLYASLKILNNIDTNVLTIEDPIEYTLKGINQVQLREDIGLGFTEALRSFLRQDPDIIMLGEIRDQKTAQMAIRAALTGHLVLSTIHTNSAWGTVSRLTDMGLPPYLIASTMNATVAQRLVRLLCNDCKKKVPFSQENWPVEGKAPEMTHCYEPQGCESCHYTGYSGRKAIYEVIPVDKEISGLIRDNVFDIDDVLKKKGIIKMADQARSLVRDGYTGMEEIYNLLLE